MAIQFSTTEHEAYTIVAMTIPGKLCRPDEIATLNAPKVTATKGVVLSGRGPVWLYTWLAHEYHPTAWVATYDPRLGGAVVVESHVPDVEVGQVIPMGQERA